MVSGETPRMHSLHQGVLQSRMMRQRALYHLRLGAELSGWPFGDIAPYLPWLVHCRDRAVLGISRHSNNFLGMYRITKKSTTAAPHPSLMKCHIVALCCTSQLQAVGATTSFLSFRGIVFFRTAISGLLSGSLLCSCSRGTKVLSPGDL